MDPSNGPQEGRTPHGPRHRFVFGTSVKVGSSLVLRNIFFTAVVDYSMSNTTTEEECCEDTPALSTDSDDAIEIAIAENEYFVGFTAAVDTQVHTEAVPGNKVRLSDGHYQSMLLILLYALLSPNNDRPNKCGRALAEKNSQDIHISTAPWCGR